LVEPPLIFIVKHFNITDNRPVFWINGFVIAPDSYQDALRGKCPCRQAGICLLLVVGSFPFYFQPTNPPTQNRQSLISVKTSFFIFF
jgi:hypothetical protein